MTSTAPIAAGYVEVNSARLYHEVRGDGPAVLFIPGATVDSAHFAAVAELLADEFRTVTYDRRGNGNSPRPSGWHSTNMAEQADDAAGLIEMLGLAPCAVWGGSLGGVVLLELLARRPGLVRAAMLHEPPLFTVLDDGEPQVRQLVESAGAAVRHQSVDAAFTDHVRTVLSDAFDQLPAPLRARMAANAQVFFDLEVPGLVNSLPDATGLSRLLARVDIPMTCMADPEGRNTPPFRAASWLAKCLGTELHELAGGHMPYATEPPSTAAAIRTLLRH
jgi:acetyltransferase/esterase